MASMGTGNWREIGTLMKDKNERQCKERWTNYADPCLSKDNWTAEEDAMLCAKLVDHGTKWKQIVPFFPGRSKNFLKTRCTAIRAAPFPK
jgi:hypothetical protein